MTFFGSLDELECFTDAVDRLCKAMLVESKWYYSGSKPSLEEYLNNGWVSSSGPVILVHAFLLSKQPMATQVLDGLDRNPGSQFCFRNGCSQSYRRPHFDSWKKLNEEVRIASPYLLISSTVPLNLARVVHCIYQHGDGLLFKIAAPKDRSRHLLAQPFHSWLK
ncbi:E-beta-ocimene/myrcene synthase [Cinnamomum micranthum f. kanehirae]|uniref:E-beta-ocimene/myrcene synthase n=1 Tax=Cinnamomum micranthum f. kanehirae TaxID=337451 RepID=A0A3S3PUV3_9MAGN|nr:E-beta-ocimene/myrcene synthase [Cinnamomum micranthum f. kanehirae]